MIKGGGPEGLGVEWAQAESEAAFSAGGGGAPTVDPVLDPHTGTALSSCQAKLLAILKQQSLPPAPECLKEKPLIPVSFSPFNSAIHLPQEALPD